MTMRRSFPWQYRADPAGGGPIALDPAAGITASPGMVGAQPYKVTPGARTTPLGSAIYLPPIKAMLDRTLPPEQWNSVGGS